MSYFRVGDHVLVNGWGFGRIASLGDSHHHHPDEWVVVEDAIERECDCGHRHTHRRRTTANVMHVGLTAGELDRREAAAGRGDG